MAKKYPALRNAVEFVLNQLDVVLNICAISVAGKFGVAHKQKSSYPVLVLIPRYISTPLALIPAATMLDDLMPQPVLDSVHLISVTIYNREKNDNQFMRAIQMFIQRIVVNKQIFEAFSAELQRLSEMGDTPVFDMPSVENYLNKLLELIPLAFVFEPLAGADLSIKALEVTRKALLLKASIHHAGVDNFLEFHEGLVKLYEEWLNLLDTLFIDAESLMHYDPRSTAAKLRATFGKIEP